jgi:predicted MFS family arabinose efflux permease
LAGASLILINAPLLAASPTVVAVTVGLFVWNFAATLLATPMGAQALEVQRQYGRPLVSTFTACFSLGVFSGGGLGVLSAAVGMAPAVQMAISTGVLGALLLVSGRWLPDEERPRPAAGAQRRRVRDRFTPQLRLIAVMAFLSAFIASAVEGWCAIYTAETLGAGTAMGAATYTSMSIAGTLALLAGDRVVVRVGRRRFFRATTVVAAAGLGLALAIGAPAAAVIGFVIVGLGLAGIDPTIMGFADDQPELTAGEGVSVVELGQVPGSLLAPALIGIVAGAIGLRAALVAAIVAILGLAILAGRIRVRSDDEVARA